MENNTRNSSDQTKETPEEKLFKLSCGPVTCPITSCNMLIFPSTIATHYFDLHALEPEHQIYEAFDSQRSLQYVRFEDAELDKNLCLGMLLYAGFEGKPETLPTRRFLAHESAPLLMCTSSMTEHMPVMLMMCRATWSALLSKKIAMEHVDVSDESRHIFLVWCVANTVMKLYVTLTIFDDLYSKSRSATRLVRQIRDSQDVNQFGAHDSNYLLLTMSDIKSMVSQPTGTVNMEIILHEHPTITPASTEESSSKKRIERLANKSPFI